MPFQGQMCCLLEFLAFMSHVLNHRIYFEGIQQTDEAILIN